MKRSPPLKLEVEGGGRNGEEGLTPGADLERLPGKSGNQEKSKAAHGKRWAFPRSFPPLGLFIGGNMARDGDSRGMIRSGSRGKTCGYPPPLGRQEG